jgi:hypothetical protein
VKNASSLQKLFLFLGSVFALLSITAGVMGYLITGPARGDVEAEPIVVTSEAAQRLDDRMEALRREVDQASVMGRHIEVTLVITEEEATSKVIQLSETGEVNMDIDYAQIYFIDGTAYCFGTVDLVIEMNISLEATIEVKDGKPDIAVKNLHIGRLSMPGTLVDQVMRAVMSHYEERLDNMRIDLEEITIGNGKMIIRGLSK